MSRLAHHAARIALAALLAAAVEAPARTRIVHSGESIAAAVDAAQSGDRILVQPGTYHEGAADSLNAIAVTRDDIELIGNPHPGRPVILENAGAQSYGIWVSPPDSVGALAQADDERPPCGTSGARLRHFALAGFTVRGFAEHGVHLACVDAFSLTDNVSAGNAVYGLFPILSRHGVVARNEVTDTGSDAALYIGQSDDVLIARNHVHDSLLGIEVQNSRECAVVENDVHDNTVGILVDIEGGKIIGTQESTLVASNSVHDNNRANSAEPDDFIGVLPPGIGVLLVGPDTSLVAHNRVSGNGFAGIGVVSYCLGLALFGLPCTGLDVDPFPDSNRIADNVLQGNGTVPSGNPALDPLRADLVWDGTGAGNCWVSNVGATSVPPLLPECQ